MGRGSTLLVPARMAIGMGQADTSQASAGGAGTWGRGAFGRDGAVTGAPVEAYCPAGAQGALWLGFGSRLMGALRSHTPGNARTR